MATPSNLMGLGMGPFLATRLGMNVIAVTCAGDSSPIAKSLPGQPGVYYVNASNSGSGVALPAVGGQSGVLLGDEITIANILGATIAVYANANSAGSAVTLFGRGLSAAGTTGVSLATGIVGTFYPITVSTWVFDASV